ncbi:hypothetical protein AAVH_08584 [Aphelenchoides avenae]|nr:hypothetical protein AAVH_08584 [Aphelenchus avenae]
MVKQEPGWTQRGPGTYTDDSSTTDSDCASRSMTPLARIDARAAFVGMRTPFTIADALALHILRQDRRYRNLPCRKVEHATTEACDAECTAVIGNGELSLPAQEAETFNLNQAVLQHSYTNDNMKLSSAGLAYAYCYMEVVRQKAQRTVYTMRDRGIKIGLRTEKQMTHDVQHVYEATVEVGDEVYWSAVLTGHDVKLKYPTAQKEDLLARVQEISLELKFDTTVERSPEEQPDENVVADAVASDENFVNSSISAARAIGVEFDKVVDWFFEEWFPLQNNFWKAINARLQVHGSGAIMILLDAPIKNGSWTYSILEKQVRERWKNLDRRPFEESPLNYPIIVHVMENWTLKVVILEGTEDKATHTRVAFPTNWPLEGEALSPQFTVPGLLSISPSRDSAVTNKLMAAYTLGVLVLQGACANYTAWKPTKEHMVQVKKLCTIHHVRQETHQAAHAAVGRNAE